MRERKPVPGIDRQHQRGLPAVLLGVQRHHLIESDRVDRCPASDCAAGRPVSHMSEQMCGSALGPFGW